MGIIRFFDRHRQWNNRRVKWLDRLHLYGIFNIIWDFIANIVLAIYFKLTQKKYSIDKLSHRVCKGLVISFTSFPKRIRYVWMTVESLLRPGCLPERIILYLSKEQFPNGSADLPKSLIRMCPRGLDIRFVDGDLRSHKKYFYAFQEFTDKVIVTVDDDALYPEDLTKALWQSHLEHPGAVIGNRAKRIYSSIPVYEHWPQISGKCKCRDLLFIGCAGILYPPHVMHGDVFDVELIKHLAFSADDIWLSCMARLNHADMVATGYDYHHLQVLIPENETLIGVNMGGGNRCTVDKINEYYGAKIGKRPFVDMVES